MEGRDGDEEMVETELEEEKAINSEDEVSAENFGPGSTTLKVPVLLDSYPDDASESGNEPVTNSELAPEERQLSEYHHPSNSESAPTIAATTFREDWLCCDKCQTWRLLPRGTFPEFLPDKWLCSMLDWLPGMNNCSFSEEETTKATKALLNQDSYDQTAAEMMMKENNFEIDQSKDEQSQILDLKKSL